MKILFRVGYISENAIFMQFMLSYSISIIQPVLNVIRNIGDLPVVSNNHKLIAKLHSGILCIIDTMRLMSRSGLLLEYRNTNN